MSDVASCYLRWPRSLKPRIKRASKREGCSINQFVAMAVRGNLIALYAEDYFRRRIARDDLDVFDRAMSLAGGKPLRTGNKR